MFDFFSKFLGYKNINHFIKPKNIKTEIEDPDFNKDELFFYNKDLDQRKEYINVAEQLNPNCHIRIAGGSSQQFEWLEYTTHNSHLHLGQCLNRK